MPRDAAGYDEIDPIERDATLRPISEVTTRPDSALPSATQYPNCPGCGTSVERPGQFCPACAMKPQFAAPKATIEVGAQPEIAYKDGGPNTARVV